MSVGNIVVGVDESDGAAAALRWAVAESELHDADLVAVMAWGLLDQHQAAAGEPFDPSYGNTEARRALRSYVAGVLGTARAERVRLLTVCDLPARALLDAAAHADLLVVGARGLGGFRGLLLGSVSQRCLHEAHTPVAVIRDLPAPAHRLERVVVGIDGSENARRALRWAIDEATVRKAELEVVAAWQWLSAGFVPPPAAAPDPVTYEEAAAQLLEEALAAEDTTGIVALRSLPMHGSAAATLLQRSLDADLLVVGSHGRGTFERAVLGSVSTQVSHHASCPLVVVPA